MGTAYEYSAKLKLLQRFLTSVGSPRRILIGGLPEAYGVGLDLALLAALQDCHVVVADDRPDELGTFAAALESPPLSRWVPRDRFEVRRLGTLTSPTVGADPRYDLWVTTSAIQRLKGKGLGGYLAQVRECASHAVLLAPNKDNRAHLTLTKMDGFHLPELVALCRDADLVVEGAGYVDLPPFPPGIKRSEAAKQKAAHSGIERFAMRGLEWWSCGERYLPRPLKRRYAHLTYVLLGS